MKTDITKIDRENAFKDFDGATGFWETHWFCNRPKMQHKNCIQFHDDSLPFHCRPSLTQECWSWYIFLVYHLPKTHARHTLCIHSYTLGMESCSSSETKVNNIASLFLQCLNFRQGISSNFNMETKDQRLVRRPTTKNTKHTNFYSPILKLLSCCCATFRSFFHWLPSSSSGFW